MNSGDMIGQIAVEFWVNECEDSRIVVMTAGYRRSDNYLDGMIVAAEGQRIYALGKTGIWQPEVLTPTAGPNLPERPVRRTVELRTPKVGEMFLSGGRTRAALSEWDDDEKAWVIVE